MKAIVGADVLPTAADMANLLLRITLNLAVTAIIVRVVYYRLYRERDYIFTYFLLNIVTFSLAFLLNKVPIGLGFALGLFAVFGILRYRTEAIQVRNLTYLFVVIGIALLNALSNEQISLVELLIVNGLILGAVCLFEMTPSSVREQSRRVLYDRLDLLGPDTADALLEDLRARTRLPIVRFEIGNVDLLRDTVEIDVYYPLPAPPGAMPPEAATAAKASTSAPAAAVRAAHHR
jgi:hypothetical protein